MHQAGVRGQVWILSRAKRMAWKGTKQLCTTARDRKVAQADAAQCSACGNAEALGPLKAWLFAGGFSFSSEGVLSG